MLEKINNINSDLAYSSKKKKISGGLYQTTDKERIEDNDSILFSPAAKFLSKIDWQLKEIKNISKDKYTLDFLVSDYEFKIEIDLVNFSLEKRQKFIVVDRKHSKNNKRIAAWISLVKDITVINENSFPLNLKGIDELFVNLLDLCASENPRSKEAIVETINKKIPAEAEREFQIIFSCVFTFMNKLGKFRHIKLPEYTGGYLNPVVIEQIATLNV